MKSVKQWLETIADEEIRRRALLNYSAFRWSINIPESEDMANSLASAIDGFRWAHTNEGHIYWQNITKQAESNTLKTYLI